MRSKLLNADAPITYAIVLHTGDEVIGELVREGYVRPTLEVILIQPPNYLCKRKDHETGLALIDIA